MSWKFPSLAALRSFEAAARHMSFTKAAAELNLTQSGVSRQIKLAEDYRSLEIKSTLMRSLRDMLVEHGGVSVEHAWVYLSDVPAAHMIEYGEILPERGQESQWLANLPEAARQLLLSPGKG